MLAVGSARVLGPTEPRRPGVAAPGWAVPETSTSSAPASKRRSERGWSNPTRWRPSEQLLRGRGQPAVTPDDNETPALHISHAIINTDAGGTRIVKDFKKSPRRTDLAMASIMAFDRAKELVGKTIEFW